MIITLGNNLKFEYMNSKWNLEKDNLVELLIN